MSEELPEATPPSPTTISITTEEHDFVVRRSSLLCRKAFETTYASVRGSQKSEMNRTVGVIVLQPESSFW